MTAAKVQTRITRILASDAPNRLKVMKLQTLALRCMASSPIQKDVIAAYKALEQEPTK